MTEEMTDRVRAYFDELGVGEWERLESWPAGRVSLAVHQRFLADHVRPGDRVLEIGAGPGRFTLELARLGARVVVTDVSPVQLELNERYVRQLGGEHAVEQRRRLDVWEAATAGLGRLDLVTAFGGPLSYVFEDAPAALRGLLGMVPPGRPVVASVMSLCGAWRAFLSGVLDTADEHGDEATDRIPRTGDLRPYQPAGHVCQLYSGPTLRDLVATAGGELLAASASSWASIGDRAAVDRFAADPVRWAAFVDQGVRICRKPGTLDGGTYLLFAAGRPAAAAAR